MVHAASDVFFSLVAPLGSVCARIIGTSGQDLNGGFPKLGVPFLGVSIIRIIVYWGLHWVPLFWETTK